MQDQSFDRERRKRFKETLNKYVPPRDQWTPVDEALYRVEDVFSVEKSIAEKLRFKAIKYAFDYHYSNSRFYCEFCQQREVKPEDIKEQSDLSKIPLIPDIFFKDYPGGIDFVRWLGEIFTGRMPNPTLKRDNPSFDGVIDALEEKGVTVLYSSGTSGRFSFIPRDRISWMRQVYAYIHAYEIAPPISNPKGFPLALHPSKTHLFLLRVLGTAGYELLSTLRQGDDEIERRKRDVKLTTDMIRFSMGITKGIKENIKARVALTVMKRWRDKRLGKLITFLENCDREKQNTYIIETPFTVDDIMSRLENQGKRITLEGSILVTVGGWKLQEGRRTPEKEFREKVERVLGIPGERCRDFYGMVECSVGMMACEGHYKHIPHSILYPMVLNEDFEPIGYGEYGRFAFLDPLANSYPGFIMTGDWVKLLESCPACSRPGPVIEPDLSRVKGMEDRGCGVVMRRLLTE